MGTFLIGLCLMLGICVRISGIAGAMLMLLYYFPILTACIQTRIRFS